MAVWETVFVFEHSKQTSRNRTSVLHSLYALPFADLAIPANSSARQTMQRAQNT